MTQFSPNALCFGDEFTAAGAPCFVQVSGDGLTITFESEGGDGQYERPCRSLRSPSPQAGSTMTISW